MMLTEKREGLYSIGEMSEITGITIASLRYYDKFGLIKPSYVDKNTNYRYYSGQYVWKIEIIKIYKKLGLSLTDIKTLIDTQDYNTLLSTLNANREHIEKIIEEHKQVLSDLKWMKEQAEFLLKETEVDFYYKTFSNRYVMYVQATDENDTKLLQTQFQKQVTKEMLAHASVRRSYGYVLNEKRIMQGQIAYKGAYVFLDEYLTCRQENLLLLPAGEYLCVKAKVLRKQDILWISHLRAVLEKTNQQPELVIANEVSLYLFDTKDTLYEVQVLCKK